MWFISKQNIMKLLKFSVFFPDDCAKEVQDKIKESWVNAEYEIKKLLSCRAGHKWIITEWDGKIETTVVIKL